MTAKQPVAPVSDVEKKTTLDTLAKAGEGLAWTAGYVALPWLKVKHRVTVTNEVPEWGISSDGVVSVNPSYIAGAQGAERVFVLAHGMLRFLMRHFDRGVALGIHDDQGQIPEGHEHEAKLWGRACAMTVNSPLKQEGVGRAPANAEFIPPAYVGAIDAESIYHYLLKNEPPPPPGSSNSGGSGPSQSPQAGGLPQPNSQGDGESGEDEGSGGSDSSGGQGFSGDDIDQMRREVEALARQAGRGTAIADMLKPKLARTDWRQVLRSGFESASTEASDRTRNTYSRASRRESLMPELCLPGKIGDDPSIAVVIDVSGSVSRGLVKKAADETLKLASQYNGVRVFFVTHTSEVCFADWLREGGDTRAIETGTGFSGGTDAGPAYEKCREVAPRGKFDVLVHFTDCELGTWPTVPARRLVVGACGVTGQPGQYASQPPPGAKIIPVTEGVI